MTQDHLPSSNFLKTFFRINALLIILILLTFCNASNPNENPKVALSNNTTSKLIPSKSESQSNSDSESASNSQNTHSNSEDSDETENSNTESHDSANSDDSKSDDSKENKENAQNENTDSTQTNTTSNSDNPSENSDQNEQDVQNENTDSTQTDTTSNSDNPSENSDQNEQDAQNENTDSTQTDTTSNSDNPSENSDQNEQDAQNENTDSTQTDTTSNSDNPSENSDETEKSNTESKNSDQNSKSEDYLIEGPIFRVSYNEVKEQPNWLEYTVRPNLQATTSRNGRNFYEVDSVHTSNDDDYYKNVWDKGHLAPAAAFVDRDSFMHESFSYLNCSLQHQSLNRGQWAVLERELRNRANQHQKSVCVRIELIFNDQSITLPTDAVVPSGYIKYTYIEGVGQQCYQFKNEKPVGSWREHIIDCPTNSISCYYPK